MVSPNEAQAPPPWKLVMDGICATIAANESIDASQAKLEWRYLIRAGKRVALVLTLHGPRRMRPHAIWTWVDGKVLYYDSGGKRWREDEVDPTIEPDLGPEASGAKLAQSA